MSYIRWGSPNSRGEPSIWYVYWCVTDSPYKEDQLLDICSVKAFTYKELKENIQKCLNKVKVYAKKNFKNGCTKEEIQDLKGYMKSFMEDVETDTEINEAETVRNTPEKNLPLLISQIKTEKSMKLLTQRLKGL